MKILISPAKLMDTTKSTALLKTSTPKFIEEANFIQSHLREKDPKFLADLMEISSKLADENWERNQKWTAKPGKSSSAPALFAFRGEVYRGLDADTLDKNAVNYLQKNLRMISGLYGLLKPSDRIMLYRLEIGRPFSFDGYKNLYHFWTEKLTDELNNLLGKNEFVLNLASSEYTKVIDRKQLKAKVYDVDFFEMKSGKPKTIVVYTKHARGALVRFCAENNVKDIDGVKAFNTDGYILDEERTTDKKLVFTR